MGEVARRVSRPATAFQSALGFTLIEVLVALCLTTIVMAAVFRLLSGGQRTAEVQSQVAHLQGQTRFALDQVTRDIDSAGVDLPPEFPVFTPPGVNPFLDSMREIDAMSEGPLGTDVIEMVGNVSRDVAGGGSIEFTDLTRKGGTAIAQLDSQPSQIQVGDLVVLYDDKPTGGAWMFALVRGVTWGEEPAVELLLEGGASVSESETETETGTETEIVLPKFIESYNRSQPTSGYITPITVVGYYTSVDDSTAELPSERVLFRQVNWGTPTPVAYLEALDIRYLIGGTLDDIMELPLPWEEPPSGEPSLSEPLIPQPNPKLALNPARLVRGVKVTVTGRLHQANMEGAKVLEGQDPSADGFVRRTFSSRVATRNILFALATRNRGDGFN